MPERALGVKKANLPDPDDYAYKLEAIRHKYNQAVDYNFVGDEYLGSERKLPLRERMTTSVKKV